MDSVKIGKLIAELRKEKNMTQKELADKLGVVNKTVSKWECGLGCPDISFWSDLSSILGADMIQMMEGEIISNKPDSGNLAKVNFYICPDCGNILFSTGRASIFCCGRKLDRENISDTAEDINLKAEESDIDYHITFDHPMTKDHYISFVAYVNGDKVLFHRLYPEQTPSLRIPAFSRGKLYLYCNRHGLRVYDSLF